MKVKHRNNLARTNFNSTSANLYPMHMRGPRENGKYRYVNNDWSSGPRIRKKSVKMMILLSGCLLVETLKSMRPFESLEVLD